MCRRACIQAISTFSGVTRNHHDGKSVVLLRHVGAALLFCVARSLSGSAVCVWLPFLASGDWHGRHSPSRRQAVASRMLCTLHLLPLLLLPLLLPLPLPLLLPLLPLLLKIRGVPRNGNPPAAPPLRRRAESLGRALHRHRAPHRRRRSERGQRRDRGVVGAPNGVLAGVFGGAAFEVLLAVEHAVARCPPLPLRLQSFLSSIVPESCSARHCRCYRCGSAAATAAAWVSGWADGTHALMMPRDVMPCRVTPCRATTQAVHFLIDFLKKVVTIWKEEHYGPQQQEQQLQEQPAEAAAATSSPSLSPGTGADAAAAAAAAPKPAPAAGAAAGPPPAWKVNVEFEQPTIGSLNLLEEGGAGAAGAE